MNDIHDVRPMIEILPWWEEYFWWILGIVVGVLCVFIYKYYDRILPKRVEFEVKEERISAYEYALRQLEGAREYMGRGEDKRLAEVLSDALREYLEKAYAMRAYEETTEEFLNDVMERHLFPVKMVDELKYFLELCDVAKFARRSFEPDDRDLLYRSARSFLDYAEREMRARKRSEELDLRGLKR